MTQIHQTRLPGVGMRHDFETNGGDRIGVIHHHSGRRDLLIYDRDDPDSCQSVIPLDEDDSHNLTELLGAAQVVQEINQLQQSLGGLVIDWIPISKNWSCAGHTIAEVDIRTRTGVLIVAVVRGQDTTPSPMADFVLQSGDIAVVIGKPDAIKKAVELLQEA